MSSLFVHCGDARGLSLVQELTKLLQDEITQATPLENHAMNVILSMGDATDIIKDSVLQLIRTSLEASKKNREKVITEGGSTEEDVFAQNVGGADVEPDIETASAPALATESGDAPLDRPKIVSDETSSSECSAGESTQNRGCWRVLEAQI